MQKTQLDNVDYAQKICGVMGMNKKLSLCAYAVQMGVVDPIVCHRIRVWNLQPDLRGIHHKNQRHVNIDDDNFGNSVEGELEVPLKEMACVVMQHVAVAPKISITIGLQLFFWE